MNEEMKAVIYWAHAHNYPVLVIGNNVLWLTNYQSAEFNAENGNVTWHDREYFTTKLLK